MNSIWNKTSRRINKKGFVFLLDIMLTLGLLLAFILTLLTFSISSASQDSSQYILTQSLYTTIDQSNLASDAVSSGSTTELEAFFDEGMPTQFCAQALIYSTANSLLENATQAGCTFTTEHLTSAFGTIVTEDTTYILEVYLWRN